MKVIISKDTDRIISSVEREVNSKFNSSTEFNMLLKGKWNKEGFVITPEYYIPKQEVTYGSCDTTDPTEIMQKTIKEGFNVLLHRHPPNLDTFSAHDLNVESPNFDCSILRCNQKYADATLRMKHNGGYLILRDQVEIVVDTEHIDISSMESPAVDSAHKYGSLFDGIPIGNYNTGATKQSEPKPDYYDGYMYDNGVGITISDYADMVFNELDDFIDMNIPLTGKKLRQMLSELVSRIEIYINDL